jgi:hypothetical protein
MCQPAELVAQGAGGGVATALVLIGMLMWAVSSD